MRYLFILILTISITSCKSDKSVNSDLERWQETADNITIIRDNFGVPHIYGKTDEMPYLDYYMHNVKMILIV